MVGRSHANQRDDNFLLCGATKEFFTGSRKAWKSLNLLSVNTLLN